MRACTAQPPRRIVRRTSTQRRRPRSGAPTAMPEATKIRFHTLVTSNVTPQTHSTTQQSKKSNTVIQHLDFLPAIIIPSGQKV